MLPSSLASRNDKSMQDRLLIMWTKEEDDILRDQVKLHGIDKWAKIATHLCGKTSRQCRRRWHMFLNVVNKRGGWSAEEDKLLLEAHRKFGNRWTEIAKNLPGRTDNAVKNRFCVLCKKQTKEVEVSPLQRPIDSGSDIAKHRLPGRRLLEGTKAILASGANKKMRTEASHNRKPEGAVQQTPLEETLQQWKGLQCSEELSCSPHQLSKEVNLRPWGSEESTVLLHHNTQDERFQGWMGLAVEGKGMSIATHPQMQLRQTFQQWEGSQSGASNNDPTCSTSSLPGEKRPLKVLESHTPTLSSSGSSSGHSRPMQENSQQLKRENTGDLSSADHMHHQRMLKRTHSTWCRAKTTDSGMNLGPKQRPDNDLMPRWKGVDRNMTSDVALQQSGSDEARHHWKQNFQNSVTVSHNHQRSIDENLPPLSEMNSLAGVYMSNPKQRTLLSGMQGWSAVQPGKQDQHVQQSTAGGAQTWGHSLAKEANDRTSNTKPKENMNEWQDWNSDEVGYYSPCPDRPLEHIMEIDDLKPDDSTESISCGASVQTLPLWTSPVGSTVLQRAVEKTQQWNKSETPTKSPRQLLEDRTQQWQKPEASGHPGSLMSMLSRFAGRDSKVTTQLLSQGGYKSQLIEDSWQGAVEKFKRLPATFTAAAKLQSPRGVVGFEEYMSGGSKDSDLETATVFPPAVSNPLQTSKADDSKWQLSIDVKDGEDGEMNTRAGLLPGSRTTCAAGIDVCGEPDDEVKLTTAEEEASRVTESPPPDVRPDGVFSPTQIVPRSHVTMECMPSPQFSDSEKEFLLGTLALDQATTNCWSSSPLRPPFPFSKARNPLFDTRYDTPARSPLSSCLLRQFQVSDTPNQT